MLHLIGVAESFGLDLALASSCSCCLSICSLALVLFSGCLYIRSYHVPRIVPPTAFSQEMQLLNEDDQHGIFHDVDIEALAW